MLRLRVGMETKLMRMGGDWCSSLFHTANTEVSKKQSKSISKAQLNAFILHCGPTGQIKTSSVTA